MNAAQPSRRDVDVVGSTLSYSEMDALGAGKHRDVFSVLGPHQIEAGCWEIRVLLPNALSVGVIEADGSAHPMARVHPAGLFVAHLAGEYRPAYRLHVRDPHGEWLHEDTYRFGPLLDQAGLHALAKASAPWHVLGCHPRVMEGVAGASFALWAPNASRASVVGDFNDWDGRVHCMRQRFDGGMFDLFIPHVAVGARYKFELLDADGCLVSLKADPFAFAAEHPPSTASLVAALPEKGGRTKAWIERRAPKSARNAPVSIYECHLASWMRVPEENNRYLTYRELSERLVPYVKSLGFTHIELLPVSEYPFDGSWGYQPVSLFAPTSRFGTPDDFMRFVDSVHAADIGLILDWVPAHFPRDAHGLASFDGTHLFEHADPRQGYHHDWGTLIYNFDRAEIAGFLIANAQFWLDVYGIDGLRVDAVASMLYLDYSRKEREWIPNRYGGRENLGAIEFMQRMNERAYGSSPGVVTIAEESTSWPGVSRPTYLGGLGFGYKWNMGWMNDTLRYMSHEPVHRSYHHNDMTFGLLYAFSENFVLPLSHDEVVHGKRSLIGRMPGDQWQRFANLRAYFGFMWGHPGKKLLFMGGEFAQIKEWNHDQSLDWHLLQSPQHAGMQALIRDLNHAYTTEPALHQRDCEASGFQWLVGDDAANSVFAFARRGEDDALVIVACNFTPVVRHGYRVGVPQPGFYGEILNTDSRHYGGSDVGNQGGITADRIESHGQAYSIALTLPPLATVFLRAQKAS